MVCPITEGDHNYRIATYITPTDERNRNNLKSDYYNICLNNEMLHSITATHDIQLLKCVYLSAGMK